MKIKYNHFLLLIVLFISSMAIAQNNEGAIKDIRRKYKIIYEDNSMQKVQLVNEEFMDFLTDGGGELNGYYKGEKLRRINEWVGISNGFYTIDYYIWNGKVFFIFATKVTYTYNIETDEWNYDKLNIIYEKRYYFKKGKIIEVKYKGETEKEDLETIASQYIQSVKRYTVLLNEKKRSF